ncbi:hypothetical protein [Leptospira bouyouniensis]|uniref:hypothetical protein n=1 Tax=Leptospira bouyouniensis TaxID=2484911 RepID=UPI001090BE99|nr:hypothetical protein [Leptospira bouyouniensis]TGM74771.1 hypothetical protein EHQ99_17505 [Leptospira bouyouniensis]
MYTSKTYLGFKLKGVEVYIGAFSKADFQTILCSIMFICLNWLVFDVCNRGLTQGDLIMKETKIYITNLIKENSNFLLGILSSLTASLILST